MRKPVTMKKVILVCSVMVSCLSLARGNNYEFDGSGDLKPPRPVSDLSQRILSSFKTNPVLIRQQERAKLRTKRIVRSILPSLVKSYLDFHLPEFVHLYVGAYLNSEGVRDLFRSNDVIATTCQAHEAKITSLEAEVDNLKTRLSDLGNRMDGFQKTMDEYKSALTTYRIPESKNKTFLETDRANDENIQLDASLNDVTLLQDTAELLTVTPTPKPKSSCVKKFLPKRDSNSPSPMASTQRVVAVSMQDPQFYILNGEKKTEMKLSSVKVRSVTYDPSTKFIIWSNYSSKSPGIFSVRLRRPKKIKRLSTMASDGMTVDSCKRWLFFTTIAPRPTISRMTTKGRHYKRIRSMRKHGSFMYSIAVDPLKGLIFTCHQSLLLETTYDGKKQRELVSKGSAIFAVTLDLDARMLYYGQWGEIRQMSLETGSNSTVAKVSSSPRNLAYHDNYLYADKGKFVYVYDVIKRSAFMLGKVNASSISLCLIP